MSPHIKYLLHAAVHVGSFSTRARFRSERSSVLACASCPHTNTRVLCSLYLQKIRARSPGSLEKCTRSGKDAVKTWRPNQTSVEWSSECRRSLTSWLGLGLGSGSGVGLGLGLGFGLGLGLGLGFEFEFRLELGWSKCEG